MIAASIVSLQHQNTSYGTEEEQQRGPGMIRKTDVSTDIKVTVAVGIGKCHWFITATNEPALAMRLPLRLIKNHY